jgi:hypothetical protein
MLDGQIPQESAALNTSGVMLHTRRSYRTRTENGSIKVWRTA